ncbi:MAG: protein-export chaperone SecB [Gammaproteobacteria bacterium]|nr:protein-export chaperone SecB [Gammaproteobacteria bacterium]
MSESKFEINRVYIKDLSSEAPNTPEIFKQDWEPEINLKLDNNLKKLEEEGLYEVSLVVNVTATVKEQTAYVVEVEQAGIFTIEGFEDEQTGYIIGALVPNILFPYARETISSLTQKAGFPPMTLNPIDFNALYQQYLAEQQAEAEEVKTH